MFKWILDWIYGNGSLNPYEVYVPNGWKRRSSPPETTPTTVCGCCFLRAGFVEPWQRNANFNSVAISEHNEACGKIEIEIKQNLKLENNFKK